MKRYTSAPNQNIRNMIVRYLEMEDVVIEDLDGEWVKYDDVKEQTDKAFKDGYWSGYRLGDDVVSTEPLSVECNCEERCEELWQYWQCPAHGYKRR